VTHTIDFVVRHGYALLFFWILAEQGALPIPSAPLLLACGALAKDGRLAPHWIVLTGLSACLIPDNIWFLLGRRRGAKVLRFICRVALEPDSCVRRTETRFAKWGPRTLLFCKFVPGLNTAAPALAGMVGIPYGQFIAFGLSGGLLWTLAYVLLGFIFSKQLDLVARDAHLLGNGLLILFLTGVIAYVLYRWRERERFIQQVKGDRITPDELKHQLEAGERPVIIDLRHPLDVLTDPRTLPGALQISPEELQARNREITRDGEVVLFCT